MSTRSAEDAALIEEGLLRKARAALLGVALLVQCGLAFPNFLLHVEWYRPLWTHALAFGLLLGVGALGAFYVFAGRRPARTGLILGVGTTIAASLLADTTLTPADVLRAEHWEFGVVGWYCLALLFGARLRVLVPVLGAHAAIAFAPLTLGGPPPPEVMSVTVISAITVYGFQLMVALFGRTVRRIAATAAQASAEEETARTREAIAESAHRLWEERFLGQLDTAIPLLRAVAAGELDPDDPAVRRRCAVEAARLRRLQAESDDVPDPLAHELEAGLVVADRRGVAVELNVAGDPVRIPRTVRRELADPILTVLAASRDSARVTIVRTPERVRVGIVTDASERPPIDGAAEHVRIDETTLGEVWWVETTWKRAPA